MLYILWGEDDFSLRQALEEIKRGIGDQVILAANTTTLDGQQVTLDQLITVCGTVVISSSLINHPTLGSSNGRKSGFHPGNSGSTPLPSTIMPCGVMVTHNTLDVMFSVQIRTGYQKNIWK